nr:MAG TPA: hypothetical protein [Caudoviricetes sp.]DAN72529.1 MAG TPA: hypothetical protein [Caudoviricetes sp.]DAR41179.1 MAG TPA: hypothetical protein [Caudoviricetes sp.]DAR60979.1 MAG TPA: hypothetical protein [Caudoviricetes sp.]DAU89590.1 MAG TPA: hypothetical protein [Caudoviricetes sp.]
MLFVLQFTLVLELNIPEVNQYIIRRIPYE